MLAICYEDACYEKTVPVEFRFKRMLTHAAWCGVLRHIAAYCVHLNTTQRDARHPTWPGLVYLWARRCGSWYWQTGPVVSLLDAELSSLELEIFEWTVEPVWTSSGSLAPVPRWTVTGRHRMMSTVRSAQHCSYTPPHSAVTSTILICVLMR